MPKKSSNSVKIYYPKLSREELTSLLKEKTHDLLKELPLKTIILFGSYAKGRYTASSDVDLLVVIKDQHKDYAYHKTHNSLGIDNLQLHLYTSEEYEKLRRKSPSFIKEIEKGIVIYKET
jgi:hypothetical protein